MILEVSSYPVLKASALDVVAAIKKQVEAYCRWQCRASDGGTPLGGQRLRHYYVLGLGIVESWLRSTVKCNSAAVDGNGIKPESQNIPFLLAV